MEFDYVIIGAGIMGLTLGYQLKKKDKTLKIAILDKEAAEGAHASGRNSGVLHAGFYYLAVPYQGTEAQMAARLQLSFDAATECLRQGIHLFPPVTYINHLADTLRLTLEERRQMLMPYLFDFLKVSEGMLLITAEGWEHSWGIQQELLFCHKHRIPVVKITPEDLYTPLASRLDQSLSPKELETLLRDIKAPNHPKTN